MIDPQSAMMIVGGIGLSVGGYFGGRRTALVENSQMASETMTMLTTQIEILKAKCAEIPAMQERIKYLEELSTQRAQVGEVKEIVMRIEEKLNAT